MELFDNTRPPAVDEDMTAHVDDTFPVTVGPAGKPALLEGDPDAAIGLICSGENSGVALKALRAARRQGLKVKLLVPTRLYPVPVETYRDFFASVRHCLVLDQSCQAQLYRLIRMWVAVPPDFVSLTHQETNPFSPREIVERLRAWKPRLIRRHRPHYCDLLNVI